MGDRMDEFMLDTCLMGEHQPINYENGILWQWKIDGKPTTRNLYPL